MKYIHFFLWFVLFCTVAHAQKIPSNRVLTNNELGSFLKDEVKSALQNNANISEEKLALYFRQKFTERYFYNWETAAERFNEYCNLYPELKKTHTERALDHISKYKAKTVWKLPFNYQNGKPVNAYAIRHLARQHKMVDIGYYYFYQNKDERYLNYFTDQLSSLNTAFSNNNYETIEDGNGIYEAFRSGYRVLNWLHLHNLFLGESGYSDAEQLTTIATLLQHAQHLYEHNQEFVSGNHQTRGLSALAMLSILFQDFNGADNWYNHAMKLLNQHLEKEINADGFQFERTVHYHISDIGNYFYVYQLAKKSNLVIDVAWEQKLKSLFSTLAKIAYPDKSAPVLSDDTDTPWAEKNDISGAMTLGYLLFEDSEIGYFADNKLSAKFYWNASELQLKKLQNIKKKQPTYKSLAFNKTGYYIMRNGWELNNQMLIISAGLDAEKPDHQHGDMIGVQAMANGQVILPNYQVCYSLKDLELFKNSLTKNVALVDDELQGKKYTSNKGGSGFGKFKSLPNPKVIAFETNNNFDAFIGSHDGFEDVGVNYQRQVIYLKNDFWIVKDNFSSTKSHQYKQIWQGHYTFENGSDLLRATFENGTGLDIFQLNATDRVLSDGKRGKQWATITKNNQKNFQFITVVYPFKTFDARIDEDSQAKIIKGWKLNDCKWKADSPKSISLTKNNTSIFFSVKKLEHNTTKIEFDEVVDVWIHDENNELKIYVLSKPTAKAIITKNKVQKAVNFDFNN
jgi:hypothetical protein